MSILGTLVDQTSGSFAASGLAGAISYATLVHSLPATSPEALVPVMVSMGAVGGAGQKGVPLLLAVGGNASVYTIGEAIGTGTTVGAIAFKATGIVFHSLIR